MSYFHVIGTVREWDCDKSAAISSLILDQSWNAYTVHTVANLKDLSDRKLLLSICPRTGKFAHVRIYWSPFHRRWIATTNADDTTCDNLLSKPIYKAVSSSATVVSFATCAI